MKGLLKYLNNYKKESVLGPLFKLLEASFELFVPLVMAKMIDIGIAGGDTGYIWWMGGILVLLGVIGLVCSITAQYFAAKAAVGFSAALRRDLFRHIQSLSYSEQDTLGASTLITRMTSDVNQIQSGVNLVLRLFLRSPFIVAGAMIMAFTISPQAALAFVVAIPLLSLVVFGIMKLTIPLYQKAQSQLDHVTKVTRENLTGVRVVRAFHKEEREKETFFAANRELTHTQLFVGKISALLNPITYLLVNAAILWILWSGGWETYNGALTQGAVVALVNYMSQILVELIKLANLIVSVTKALACGRRVQAVFDTKSTLTSPENAAPQPEQLPREIVAFEDVFFAYRGTQADSLSGITFRVSRGETVGIIGGTGSGKSSLVNLIPRFYDVRAGRVLVDGIDVREYSLDELRTKVGVVPQKAVLFQGTVRENLLWGNESATEPELLEALRRAQAMDFINSRPEGLDTVIQQGGRNLSGGQRQRLTIARALVRRPEILILDDSSSALDYATDAALRQALREIEGETTVFIVSQRASSIRHAGQILVLDDGVLAGLGTHEQLLESCPVYQEICKSQLTK